MILGYEAVDGKGQSQSSTIEAPDARVAVDRLRSQGLYVTSIQENAGRRGAFHRVDFTPATRLPLRVVAQLTRQMAMLSRAGSGVVPSFSAIQRQLKKPSHRMLIGAIIDDLQEGVTLTDCLRKHPGAFNAVYCAIVAAGEASGRLTEMFERLSLIVAKARAMRKKLIGALAYPVLLVGMCTSIMLILLFFVLPRFSAMFEQLGVETPAVTSAMLQTGKFLQAYWLYLMVALAILGFSIFWIVSQDPGKQWLSNLQLKVPLLGSLRSRLLQGQIFRTMGMLLEAGVGVLETIDLARQSTRNDRFGDLFDRLHAAVTSGGRLSSAFEESGLVDPSIGQAIHTGEDTGHLGHAISYCADVLDESNEELITVAMRLIEPAILIGMGFAVGGVALALFVPLFDLTSAIQ